MQSMTGFSSGTFSYKNTTYTIYIRGVNHRFLDISLRVPGGMEFLEDSIHKTLKAQILRGRVDVSLRVENSATSQESGIDKDRVQGLVSELREVAKLCNLDKTLSIGDLLAVPKLFESSAQLDKEEFLKFFSLEFTQVLNRFKEARREEGAALKKDLVERVALILEKVDWVVAHEDTMESQFRNQLTQRYRELLEESIPQERLASEVAFLLMKYGIHEEIVRLQAHCKNFLTQLQKAEGEHVSLGKDLEFVVQEMHREVNTIGSKSVSIELSNQVITMKGAVEDIREQLRNVE